MPIIFKWSSIGLIIH